MRSQVADRDPCAVGHPAGGEAAGSSTRHSVAQPLWIQPRCRNQTVLSNNLCPQLTAAVLRLGGWGPGKLGIDGPSNYGSLPTASVRYRPGFLAESDPGQQALPLVSLLATCVTPADDHDFSAAGILNRDTATDVHSDVWRTLPVGAQIG
jgi:hypothetical protein